MKLTISNFESPETQKKLQISNEKVVCSWWCDAQADIGPVKYCGMQQFRLILQL